jgi:hypothetical protein
MSPSMAARMRSRKRATADEIRRAILRIEHRRPQRISKDRCRMNISTVAREAGISAASIHNTYPDMADAIRGKAGKGSRSDTERLEHKRLAELLRLTRQRLKAAQKDITRIASENARLVTENAVLTARVSSRNVVELAKGATRSLRQPA